MGEPKDSQSKTVAELKDMLKEQSLLVSGKTKANSSSVWKDKERPTPF